MTIEKAAMLAMGFSEDQANIVELLEVVQRCKEELERLHGIESLSMEWHDRATVAEAQLKKIRKIADEPTFPDWRSVTKLYQTLEGDVC